MISPLATILCTEVVSELKKYRVYLKKIIYIETVMNRLICTLLGLFFFIIYFKSIECTIDVNLSELEYLAGHLDPFECIRLVAALHYTTYELPKSIAGAERKVDEEIPCLRQLLHWNSSPSEGRGKTHEDIEHRLRQLNRNDLADWLGKTTFKQLGNDLEKTLENSFGDLGEQETETQYPITIDPLDEPTEENAWLPIDTLLMALLVGLVATLVTLATAIIIHKIKLRNQKRRRSRSKKNSTAKEAGSEELLKNNQGNYDIERMQSLE